MKLNFKNYRGVLLCVLEIVVKVFVSLCFCSDCRGHVVGLTPRFKVHSQVLSDVRAWLPQPPPGSTTVLQTLLENKQAKKKSTKKNIVE